VNKEEAKEILATQMRELKTLSYSQFSAWVTEKRIETPLVQGASGTEYQIEIEAMWDCRRGGDIRVVASIDDGGLRSSLLPLCDSFIVVSDKSSGGP
jgi:hypothetical protein